MTCPECGSASIQSFGKRNWFYPVGCLVIVPTVVALLHQASSPVDYRCAACGLRFARRSQAARFALGVMIFFLFLAGIAILLVFLSAFEHSLIRSR